MKKIKRNPKAIDTFNMFLLMDEIRDKISEQRHCTFRDAYVLLSPLEWYINTGRASCEFLHKLAEAKPFMIARKLCMGGTTLEVVQRIKDYLGYESTF